MHMTQDPNRYTVGELAKEVGLTVRTLQHYDNIGLLPPSGRTEGGRRYYTDADMLELTQIVFYKSVGIKLSDIRDRLSNTPTPKELENFFNGQLSLLLQKIGALQLAMSVLEASIDIVRAEKLPPWEILVELIRTAKGSSLSDWAGFNPSPSLLSNIEAGGLATLSGIMGYYNTMRELMVKAVALHETGIAPESIEGQAFGKRWWKEVVVSVTNGHDEALKDMASMGTSRKEWPVADRRLFELAEPFIEAAVAAYISQNNIAVPEMVQGRDHM
jgi:DNA-binding transcriptional MerR regulator